MFELTSRRLRWLNLTAAFFQALSGCAILGISSYDGPSSLPWFTFFIGSWSRDTAEEAAQFYRRAGALPRAAAPAAAAPTTRSPASAGSSCPSASRWVHVVCAVRMRWFH